MYRQFSIHKFYVRPHGVFVWIWEIIIIIIIIFIIITTIIMIGETETSLICTFPDSVRSSLW